MVIPKILIKLMSVQSLSQSEVKPGSHYKIIWTILGPVLPFRPKSAKARLSDGSKDYLARFSCDVRCVKSEFDSP